MFAPKVKTYYFHCLALYLAKLVQVWFKNFNRVLCYNSSVLFLESIVLAEMRNQWLFLVSTVFYTNDNALNIAANRSK